MPIEVAPKKTVASHQEMFDALVRAHSKFFGGLPPNIDPILILIAHWDLETGGGSACMNWNIGNFKAIAGNVKTDWTFFRCFEVMSQGAAQHFANNPLCELGAISATGRQTVWFAPKHPACCFASWPDLDSAVFDYLSAIVQKFSDNAPEKDAWHWACQGDVVAYCHALRLKGYYTAEESEYVHGVQARLANIQKMGLNVDLSRFPKTVQEQVATFVPAPIDLDANG